MFVGVLIKPIQRLAKLRAIECFYIFVFPSKSHVLTWLLVHHPVPNDSVYIWVCIFLKSIDQKPIC